MSRKNWGFGSVYLRGRTYWISYPFNGQQVKESSKSQDEAVARKLLKQRVQKILKGDFAGIAAERVLVDELLDDLLTDYKINGKSYDWCELVVRCHLRPFFGYCRAALVGTDLIKKYIQSRRKKEIANSTINHELALLRRAFKLGFQCEPPKVARVPRIEELEENNVRKGFFARDEFDRIYHELPIELRPVALFAFYTGCRRGEILRLVWAQFDQAHKVLRLEPGETKNDDARTVPLPIELFDVLCGLKRERDAGWPRCPHIFTRQGTPIKDFRSAWDSACIRAGLVDAEGEPSRLFHDLRRSGVRNLIRAGVPQHVAMRISGHKTESVFKRYNIVDETDLHDAAAKLTAYVGGKK